ncbi:4a-hydroxytetrahydrobiopterin dehydratase [Rhodobacterales bacterium HKCCE3408]|nr:4a-hydroxytetrahydrobiopterin dehydratase [Rhodobacterales bacterium HKCCE3408]
MTDKLDGAARDAALKDLKARGWETLPDRDAIKKSFVFGNFVEAFGWMTQIAILAEKANHHPEWSNVYKTVEVTLTTHDAGGLSEKDVALAAKMDEAAG